MSTNPVQTTPAPAPEQAAPVNLSFTIAGLPLGLLETEVNDHPEKKYHCFRLDDAKNTGYGQPIPALADALPSTVVIDGVTITLVVGMSPATKRVSGEVVAIPDAKRYPQAKYTGDHVFPSLKGFDGPDDEGIRRVGVTISSTAGGKTWNVTARVNRVPSVSPEERQTKALDKATANLAALMATFAVKAPTTEAPAA